MKVYALLKQDHKKVKDIFEALEQTTERAAKKRSSLFAELNAELSVHAEAEEALFYPRVLKPKTTHDMTLEAIEEHKVVKTLLAELDSDPKDTEQWGAKLTVLKEIVEHHVKEEEKELFELAQKVLSGEEAEEIAAEIQEFKEQKSSVPA